MPMLGHELAAQLACAARLGADLPRHARVRISTEDARRIVQGRLARRAENFLACAATAIYGNPHSPHARLLRHAGCEPGDLRTLVHAEGLEGALAALADRGVYVSVPEMKGRSDIVRGSLRFRARPRDFAQPGLRTHFPVPTGGSGGAPIVVGRSLNEYRSVAPLFGLAIAAHGQRRPAHALWQMLPTYQYVSSALGHPLLAWWYPHEPDSMLHRLGLRYAWLASRMAGIALPYPRHGDAVTPTAVARFLGQARGDFPEICLTAYSSAAVRLSLTAQELGISLQHVLMACAGEPLTDTRSQVISASGARPMNRYGTNESGSIAYGCAAARNVDDAHVSTDRFALIQRPVTVGSLGTQVSAFHFTSLVPWVPMVMLNTDVGDYGHAFTAKDCCGLGRAGYETHIQEIRSYEKLTGEAATFVVADAARLVELVLPSTFGGSPLDYQLSEEESQRGEMRLSVRVHPQVGEVDEASVREVVLRELGSGGPVARHMAELWRSAGTVRVDRAAPHVTSAGKVLPFRRRGVGQS
ncbi:MAG: hypothetical protein U0821_12710 [Chloroflexota bacterium]